MKKLMTALLILFSFLTVGAQTPLMADKIIKMDGTVIKCTVVKIDNLEVTFKENGTQKTLKANQVFIVLDELNNVQHFYGCNQNNGGGGVVKPKQIPANGGNGNNNSGNCEQSNTGSINIINKRGGYVNVIVYKGKTTEGEHYQVITVYANSSAVLYDVSSGVHAWNWESTSQSGQVNVVKCQQSTITIQ